MTAHRLAPGPGSADHPSPRPVPAYPPLVARTAFLRRPPAVAATPAPMLTRNPLSAVAPAPGHGHPLPAQGTPTADVPPLYQPTPAFHPRRETRTPLTRPPVCQHPFPATIALRSKTATDGTRVTRPTPATPLRPSAHHPVRSGTLPDCPSACPIPTRSTFTPGDPDLRRPTRTVAIRSADRTSLPVRPPLPPVPQRPSPAPTPRRANPATDGTGVTCPTPATPVLPSARHPRPAHRSTPAHRPATTTRQPVLIRDLCPSPPGSRPALPTGPRPAR